jgi:hypothetical protein
MGAGFSVDSWRLVAERGVSPAAVVVRLPVADLVRWIGRSNLGAVWRRSTTTYVSTPSTLLGGRCRAMH